MKKVRKCAMKKVHVDEVQETYPKSGLAKSNGDITLISPDAGMSPLRAGTEPGTAPSLKRDIKPIIARRPLLISTCSFFAFHSSLLLLLKPKGSYKFRGTGCGRSGPPSAVSRVPTPDCPFTPLGRLNGGKKPGLP